MWTDVNIWIPQLVGLFGCCGKLWSYVLGASRPGLAAGATPRHPPSLSQGRSAEGGGVQAGW